MCTYASGLVHVYLPVRVCACTGACLYLWSPACTCACLGEVFPPWRRSSWRALVPGSPEPSSSRLSLSSQTSCGAWKGTRLPPWHSRPQPGLHLPPAQPQDAAALLAGKPASARPAPGGLAPAPPHSSALLSLPPAPARTKMGRASPQLLPPELSGHPQLPWLPPPAPPPSSPLLTRRPQSSGPCAPSSMAS